ncbi:MAG: LysR family transcriptional regulator, partial [Cohaesibacter sp.]|nr:LysR family transcriptional regulator [Cohaesibacter sp.]
MQLRQIEVFHAYMTTGSTVAAAEFLNVSQPAVSTTLKRMQDELALKLFRSVKGRLQPTAEAHLLFRQVTAIHEDINQLEQLAKALSEGRTGNIRMGVVPALSEQIAARAISSITCQTSDLTISIEVLNSHELLHLVQAGRLDFACIFGNPGNNPVEILFSKKIPVYCVLPNIYQHDGASMTLQDYTRLPIALMRPTDPIGRMMIRTCFEQGLEPVSKIELRNCRAAIAFAEQGVTASLSDAVTLSTATLTKSRAIPFSPELSIPVSIIRKSEQQASLVEEKLIEALIK